MLKKCAALMLAMIAICIVVRLVPATAFRHPVITYQLMRTFPVGTEVVPSDVTTKDDRESFASLGWQDTEDRYGVVVDYEIVYFEKKTIGLYHVRTHGGTGYIIPLNPYWIKKK
jgi:hypothetical protein